MAIGTYISIITLNVNGLNVPTKWIKCSTGWLNGYKNKTHIYAVYKKPTSDLKTCINWKWEDEKIYFMQLGSKRKLAILVSDKIDLKIKKIIRDKEGYYIMIKGSIQEEDIKIVHI